jgi:RNA polymerase sigma factor (sigma-70 family)
VGQADKGLAQAVPGPWTEASLALVGGFDAFFDQTYPVLLKVALTVGATVPEAEDAADETMAYLYRRWGQITEPRAYACRAVASNFIKVKKRDGERVKRTVAGDHVTPAADDGTALTALEDREWVTQLLSKLPPAQRAVMACVFDGLSTAEIAEALGKTKATVRKNLQLAREHLRIELAKEHGQHSRAASVGDAQGRKEVP